jgi:HEPN domain-containing protein
MPRKESLYPRDWLRIAEKDLQRAEHLLEVHDAEAAGFYLQQAIEKFLKAFLLSNGWKLERIHDLEALLNDALAYDSSLDEFRSACQKITAFYFVERYPFVTGTGLTEEDVRSSQGQVQLLIEKIRTATSQS